MAKFQDNMSHSKYSCDKIVGGLAHQLGEGESSSKDGHQQMKRKLQKQESPAGKSRGGRLSWTEMSCGQAEGKKGKRGTHIIYSV